MDLPFKEIVHLFAIIFIFTSVGKTKNVPNTLVGETREIHYSNDGMSSFSNQHGIVKRSTTSGMVYIAIFTEKAPSGSSGTAMSAYVDSTMTKLIFQAEAKPNPVMMITKPSGLPCAQFPSLNKSANAGTVIGTVEINITAADYGIWTLTRLDKNQWDVTIMGESPVDFTYEITDVSTGAAINEDPIQGKTYKIVVTVPNYRIMKSIDMGIIFVKDKSEPVDRRSLNKRVGKYEFTYVMLNQSFMIGIQGSDNSIPRNQFRRISPAVINPVSLKLFVPPYTGVKLYENTSLDINFTVVNVGSVEQDIDVRIQDDKGFAVAPQFLSATVKPGENFTGHFTLKGGMVDGETTTAAITARRYLGGGQFGHGPSEIRQFTVVTKRTTTTTTTTSTHNAVTSLAASFSTKHASISSSGSNISLSQTTTSIIGSATTAGSSNVAAAVGAGMSVAQPTSGSDGLSVTNSVSGSNTSAQQVATGAPVGTAQSAAVSETSATIKSGQGDNESSSDEFNKGDVFTVAIVSGITGGTLVGIAGLVVMGLLFKGAINKANPTSVTPEHKPDRVRNQNFRRKHLEDHDFAWK